MRMLQTDSDELRTITITRNDSELLVSIETFIMEKKLLRDNKLNPTKRACRHTSDQELVNLWT